MADINRVVLVGRLTRDAEQTKTSTGYALLKFSIAVNRRRKQGEEWVDEANFFDVAVYGRQGEAIARYMTKGKQVAVEGCLVQYKWTAKDRSSRSKVVIEGNNIQLLGSREAPAASPQGAPVQNQGQRQSFQNQGSGQQSFQNQGSGQQGFQNQGSGQQSFGDDIPF